MKRIVFFPAVLLFLFIVFASQKSESSEELVSLKFLQPAGYSPKVFTEGWVFGADCIFPAVLGNAKDFNSQIHWSGTGKFYPEYGPETHPVFDKAGFNTIKAELKINGEVYSKTMTVIAVISDLYACVGDWVHCPACNHGCPECPHDVIGKISSGSPTVKVRGKPAARVGDGGMHYHICCGDNTFTISEGDENVLIDGKPAAIIGSASKHCGGTGVIVGDDIHKVNEKIEPKKNIGKEVNTEGIYFPLEYVPQSKIDKLEQLKKQSRAEKLLKMEGPDYSTSVKDVFSEINDLFNLECGTLSVIKETCQLNCLDNISTACGRIGIIFSVIEIINNSYEGKKVEAFYNTLKTAGYFAVDYSWSALKIASFAIVVLEYTLKRFMKEMIDSHYDEYKRGFYNYFNNEPDVKRNFKDWKAKLNDLYNKANGNKENFQSLIDEELNNYFSRFWNPEVYILYLPGFKGDLTNEERKMVEDSYKREILSPVFNAIFIGLLENEKRLADREVKQEIKKVVDNYNSKFRFIIKVNGPANKINKFPIRIGEWTGVTDSKGYWIFDATFYAYLKNKSPLVAEFTVAPKDIRKVAFDVKDKIEITFDIPKPVSIDLNITLSKDTEGAGFSAMASAINFDEKSIQSETSPIAIEWKWKLNENIISSDEGNSSTIVNSISGSLDEAKTYTFYVELINRTEGSSSYNSTIATATKTVTIKKEKIKEKEKKEITENKEEEKKITKKEEGNYDSSTKGKVVNCYVGNATWGYCTENDILKIEILSDFKSNFTKTCYCEIYKTNDGSGKFVNSILLSQFEGKTDFIFPYKEVGEYFIDFKNYKGVITSVPNGQRVWIQIKITK